MKYFLILLLPIVLITFISAQNNLYFGKVDTVTFGEYDDSSPTFSTLNFFGRYNSNISWMLFVRNTDTSSAIMGKKFWAKDGVVWDTTEIELASTGLPHTQENPSLCDQQSFRFAVWEQKENGIWNLFNSSLKVNDSIWSSPQQITLDTVDNIGVKTVPVSDSTILMMWKRENVLLYSMVTPYSISVPETVAISSFGDFEFDVLSEYSSGAIVWTTKDSAGMSSIVYKTFSIYPSVSFTNPESLFYATQIYNPHLVTPYVGYILFETIINNDREVMMWNPYYVGPYDFVNLTNDPLADNSDAQCVFNPTIIKWGFQKSTFSSSFGDAFSTECSNELDTMIVFSTGDGADTIRSNGYNRHARFSDILFSQGNRENAISAWESNRTGRSHIYGRVIPLPFSFGVSESGLPAISFDLSQNYPNPFNPTTTFQFTLGSAADVSLKAFDLLGREVATIVNERFSAGTHSRQWNASALASGIYFYTLKADKYSSTKKLILLK
jgi:hypothetical protein